MSPPDTCVVANGSSRRTPKSNYSVTDELRATATNGTAAITGTATTAWTR